MAAAYIALRIVANPIANVFQKQLTRRAASPLFIIAVVHGSLTLICLPYFFASGRVAIEAGVWTNMAIAAALAVAGNVLLVCALRDTDLSILGPINSYKSVVSLILGIFMLGERPTLAGLAGVLLIVAGSYFVMDKEVRQPRTNAFVRFFSERGIQLRFAALFLSATEAIFLKRAILLTSPWAVFTLWSALGFGIALVATAIMLRREIKGQLTVVRHALVTFTALAAATGTMQLTTILTFRQLQVGYALALFQLSTIVTVLLGRRYFAETNMRERLIGSMVMASGAILIVVPGHSD